MSTDHRCPVCRRIAKERSPVPREYTCIGDTYHHWEPGRRPSKQRCVRCKVNRAEWTKSRRGIEAVRRALDELIGMGLVEEVV